MSDGEIFVRHVAVSIAATQQALAAVVEDFVPESPEVIAEAISRRLAEFLGASR